MTIQRRFKQKPEVTAALAAPSTRKKKLPPPPPKPKPKKRKTKLKLSYGVPVLAKLADGTRITAGKPKAPGKGYKMSPERREQALKQITPTMWKPGQSGNPSGRPKMKSVTQAYKELLNSEAPCTLPGYDHMTWAQAIAYAIGVEAVLGGNVGGNVQAARELRETTEGGPGGLGAQVPAVNVRFVVEPPEETPE